MKLPFETQVLRKPFRLASIVLSLLLMLWLAAGFATTQSKKPISKDGLMKSLRIGGVSSNEYVEQIRARGVDFELTPAIEKELRAAGASSAVIEAVRANYRPQIEMVLIPAGTFMMGSPDSESGRDADEGPQHRVTVQSFYMGKYEVTQAQWRAVMGTNPSSFKGDNRPVENVSWNDAQEFCRKLSQMTGKEYRLPTEAEWEYAARAGTTTPFAFGSSLSSEQANFIGNYPYGGAAKGVDRAQTTEVGSFQANGFGLYDIHGNVYEWCQSKYKPYPYEANDGRESLSGNDDRVVRGGSWISDASHCRSADRSRSAPGVPYHNTGFRVVVVSSTFHH